MEIIILFGVFEGLIITLLILLKHHKTISDYLLSIFFLIFAINILFSYLEIYNRIHRFPYPAFVFVSSPMLFLHGPALWIYVKSVTEQHFSFKPIFLLHIVPFLLCVLNFTFHYYTIPLTEKIEIYQSESFKHKIDYPVIIVSHALSTLLYFTWSVFLIKRYNQKIKGYFSETRNYDLAWLRVLMITSVIVYSLIYSVFITDLFFPIASFQQIHQSSFIIGSFYLIILGFYGHKQGYLFSDKTIQMDLSVPGSGFNGPYSPDEKENSFINVLLDYMKEKKPYMDAEITLPALAANLSVSPEYLSRVINYRLGKNFFDFINHYRIEEFKTRCALSENKNLTLVAIAYDCGFNSKATFNRVFKKATGETPGYYIRKSHKNETSFF